MGALPEPGTFARFDQPESEWAAACDALPVRACHLLDAAKAAGWAWAVGWNEDTGGSRFVTVKGRHSLGDAAGFDASWHTRGSVRGSLLLFGCLIRTGGTRASSGWVDASVRAAITLVEDRMAPADPEA